MHAAFCRSLLLAGVLLFGLRLDCLGQLLVTPYTTADLSNSVETAIRDGSWARHLDYVETGLTNTAAAQNAPTLRARWNQMLGDERMNLALAQAVFLQRVGPTTVTSFQNQATTNAAPFLRWLLRNEEALRSCLTTIRPQNKGSRVLTNWSRLRACETNTWDKYWSLGLACALVFDKPMAFDSHISPTGTVDLVARYLFFRNSAARNRLKIDLTHLPTWELVWVVDAPVPDTDLAWAQEHVRLARSEWQKAYEMVSYRMDQALKGAQIHPTYTLEELQRVGGVCLERAHFAAMSAKANGIPAMPLVGEGERGGHAWFGYLTAPFEWNMSAGRFEDDRYVTGYTCEPLSRRYITEQSLSLLVDTQQLSSQYLLATRLHWMGQIFQDRRDRRQALVLFRTAVELAPCRPDVWNSLLDSLKAAPTTKGEWRSVLQTFRSAFKNYPDFQAQADSIEADVLLDEAGVDEILQSLRSEISRMKASDRSDLVLKTIDRHVGLLQHAGKTNAVLSVYKKALQDFGDQLPVLEKLAMRAFAAAQQAHGEADMLSCIDAICNAQLSNGMQDDPFRKKALCSLANMLAEFYTAAKQPEKALKYNQLAGRLGRSGGG